MGVLQSGAPDTSSDGYIQRGDGQGGNAISPQLFLACCLTLLMGEELTVPAKAERGAGWPDLRIGYGAALCEALLGNA